MGRRIVDGGTQHQRIQRRKAPGSLRSLLLKPSTIIRYEKALKLFLAFLLSQKLCLAKSLTLLDDQVQCYLENLWQDGESLSLAGDTISSLQCYQPSRKRNPGAWKMQRAWQVHELPPRAPPFTWQTPRILRKVVFNFSRGRARSSSRLSSTSAHGWTPVPWK